MNRANETHAAAGRRRFKPYPAYKDSGVEWLGDIPAHWEVRRLGRVPGQALDREPLPLATQVRGHLSALVGRQAVPDQEDALTPKVALEIGQEADECDAVVAPRPRWEEQARAAAVPPEGQRQGDGELRPVEGVDQDRRLAPRRPRVPDRWALRDPALVLEDEPGSPAPRVFLPRASAWSPSDESRSRCAPSRVWPGAAASS